MSVLSDKTETCANKYAEIFCSKGHPLDNIVLIYKFTSLAIFYTTLKHKLTHAWYMIIGYHVGINTVRTIVKNLYFGKAEPPGTLKQYD